MLVESDSAFHALRQLAKRGRRSTRDEMDAAVAALQSQKESWLGVPVRNRLVILDELIRSFATVSEEWVSVSLAGKDAVNDEYAAGLEWSGGPVAVLRNLRGLRRTSIDIQKQGRPVIPGHVTVRPGGQVVGRIYPQSAYERLTTPGVTAEVWMEPEISLVDLPRTQALAYQDKPYTGKTVLVLGGGNVSGIPVNDSLSKLFVEDRVVLLKMNPVNEYLGPLIEKSFRILIEEGFLRIAYGGGEEGGYLISHPDVDEIHLTGSDRTYDAIVFGSGTEGARRKKGRQPLVTKRFTSELGNVAPAIVVPGPWSSSDLDYQAERLVSHLCDNASYSCSRTRVIVQHMDWVSREELLQRIRTVLARVPLRTAYYPGAAEQHRRFLSAHPEAQQFGTPKEGQLPWTLVAGIDPDVHGDICFTTESFCPVIAETPIKADTVPEFLDRAVDFANENLWGTQSATIIVHPRSNVASTTLVPFKSASLQKGSKEGS